MEAEFNVDLLTSKFLRKAAGFQEVPLALRAQLSYKAMRLIKVSRSLLFNSSMDRTKELGEKIGATHVHAVALN